MPGTRPRRAGWALRTAFRSTRCPDLGYALHGVGLGGLPHGAPKRALAQREDRIETLGSDRENESLRGRIPVGAARRELHGALCDPSFWALAARRRRGTSVNRRRIAPRGSRSTRFSSAWDSRRSCWPRLTHPARIEIKNGSCHGLTGQSVRPSGCQRETEGPDPARLESSGIVRASGRPTFGTGRPLGARHRGGGDGARRGAARHPPPNSTSRRAKRPRGLPSTSLLPEQNDVRCPGVSSVARGARATTDQTEFETLMPNTFIKFSLNAIDPSA